MATPKILQDDHLYVAAAVQERQFTAEPYASYANHIQSFGYVVGQRLEAQPHRSDLRRSGSENQWGLLS